MNEVFERARHTLGDIRVDDGDLRSYLEARELDEDRITPDVAADLLLVCACLGGDGPALRLLDERLQQWVPASVARLKLSPAQVDEVVQRLRHRLVLGTNPHGERGETTQAKLAGYRGAGRLSSWLRVVALRVAIDLKRQHGREVEDEAGTDALMASDDPELDYLRARYAAEFKAAFAGALAELPLKDRNLLRLHLLDGLSIDKIGALHDVHRATAARWLSGARERLFRETRALLKADLGVTGTEFQSLLRLVRSNLDVSVVRLLREDQRDDPAQKKDAT